MAMSEMAGLHNLTHVIKTLHTVDSLDLLGAQVNAALAEFCSTDTWLLLTKEKDDPSFVIRSAVIKGQTKRKLHNSQAQVSGGILGTVLDLKKTFYTVDIRSNAHFDESNDAILGSEHVKGGALFVPLSDPDKSDVIGVLALYGVEFSASSAHYIEMYKAIGSEISSVVSRLRSIRDLRRMALTDVLTLLPNRRALVSIVEREAERCRRYNRHISFVLIDVDNFKSINDTDGHLHGDAVLVRMADTLRKTVRKLDYVVRLAGDEFVILMPDTMEAQQIDVTTRMVERFERDKLPASTHYSISAGAYSGPPLSLQEMFDYADKEMYKHKVRKHKRSRNSPFPSPVATIGS